MGFMPLITFLERGRDLFNLGVNSTYSGQEFQRGILCNKWITATTQNTNFGPINLTLSYYFASSTWTIRGINTNPVPIR